MELQLQKICKSLGGKPILKELSFTARSGRALGFLGRNGAGKTTSIRSLMNVFAPDSGQFLLNGQPFDRSAHRIGYLPEERGMYDKIALLPQLVYFGELKGMSAKAAKTAALGWLERLELLEHAKKPMGTLSKGNQQKIQIIQVLLDDPEILILDEPFSGLDPVNARVLKDIIFEFIERDKLLIFSSHQMGLVEEFCHDIALIRSGEILYEGSLDALKASAGKQRLHLRMEPMDQAGYERLALDYQLDFEGIDEGMARFAFKEERSLEALIQEMVAAGQVPSAYGPYRPSLERIFIAMDRDAEDKEEARA